MFKKVILPRIGIALLTMFILGITGGILQSNLVQGEYKTKYGTVRVPGSKVLHLPSGTADVAFAAFLPGAGNETPDMPIPKNLGLAIDPADPAGAKPVITRDLGSSENSSADNTNTDARIWKVDVPAEGDYRVVAKGGSHALLNQTLELGTGPLVPIGWMLGGVAVIGILAGILGPNLYARLPSRSGSTAEHSHDGVD